MREVVAFISTRKTTMYTLSPEETILRGHRDVEAKEKIKCQNLDVLAGRCKCRKFTIHLTCILSQDLKDTLKIKLTNVGERNKNFRDTHFRAR